MSRSRIECAFVAPLILLVVGVGLLGRRDDRPTRMDPVSNAPIQRLDVVHEHVVRSWKQDLRPQIEARFGPAENWSAPLPSRSRATIHLGLPNGARVVEAPTADERRIVLPAETRQR